MQGWGGVGEGLSGSLWPSSPSGHVVLLVTAPTAPSDFLPRPSSALHVSFSFVGAYLLLYYAFISLREGVAYVFLLGICQQSEA